MSEVWTQWEGDLIAGAFPLLRFVSASNHSAVFLTELLSRNLSRAAIKIIPADPVTETALLSRWRTAATLSHPHLIRIFDSGRCQLGDHQFLFIVTEYAAETLAEVLPSRALTYDEVREMLNPTLEVLTYLHDQNLVQGHLQPSNVLVVDDQPKLASDSICPFGEYPISKVSSSPYDSPEKKDGKIHAASDIWALGITIVEALTQRPPAVGFEPAETPLLPTSIPPIFVDGVRRCLSRNPAERPSVAELKTLIAAVPSTPMAQTPVPATSNATNRVVPPAKTLRRPSIQAAGIVVMILIALWAGLRLFRSSPKSSLSTYTTPQSTSDQALLAPPSSGTLAEIRPAERRAKPLTEASSTVLHEEMPDIPLSASRTIHGRFIVSVLVTADGSGNVVEATVKNAGPSNYFAHAAAAAARKWKFAPVDNKTSRDWLLQFEFTRSGVTARSTGPRV
jgi:serine/threonine protein kinase